MDVSLRVNFWHCPQGIDKFSLEITCNLHNWAEKMQKTLDINLISFNYRLIDLCKICFEFVGIEKTSDNKKANLMFKKLLVGFDIENYTSRRISQIGGLKTN